MVYKAELPTGETVAVKKMNRKKDCNDPLTDKCFIREAKTLGRIRHRHLVKMLGCCSDVRVSLIVYEYMENGSLWDWLHKPAVVVGGKRKKHLSWEGRLKIATGLARGVEYLHHDCEPRIIHRDIKSSNLLLDGDMEAHLGDFGLAKIIVSGGANSNGNTTLDTTGFTESTTCFAGSYGYIAPGTN